MENMTAAGRARRKTAKVVNYAKEQDFSDDDIFEDGADREEPRVKARGRGRPRKSTEADSLDDEEVEYYSHKVVYMEKGYDPSFPPLRERFTFMPEYEPDGSPKIELIVGRRAIEDQKSSLGGDFGDEEESESVTDSASEDILERRLNRRRSMSSRASPRKEEGSPEHVEYEYLVKYKGRSYLHLEWKTGADLESMNKSAKTLYRRFLKKVASGLEEDLEDPNFDPSFAEPQKVVDEAEQEITVELSDKELVEWEKERERALAEEAQAESLNPPTEGPDDTPKLTPGLPKGTVSDSPRESASGEEGKDEEEEIGDLNDLSLEKVRSIVNKDGPYYATFERCDNPYRDGYITTPPKKPRASYLFFQACMRSEYQKKHPSATQGEIMTMLGDTWRTMSEEEQAPFVLLAKEEAEQYERERAMMEKAQKPSEMWQPMRRCEMVLNRLANDGFANIFLAPVDLEEFPDYEEIVDQPMDLGTVRTKLMQRKYQAPENFARDVRKIWNNCKIYNQHGSAIWHVADYMSKQFERLYHAWVLEFRERYLRWINPKARPWEHTCRQCDGECGTPDDKMVLCDHCDAMYGMECLRPPLNKLPQGIWHCPDCKPKLSTVKGVRMLSAVSEQAARKRAELGDTPKKLIKQKMYLVKWTGLGYEFCTWETKGDVDDDFVIEEFHRLNNTSPDEPDLAEEEVSVVLNQSKHVNPLNAGGVSCIPDLRSQLYAQSRAFQFSKFGVDVPSNVSSECGPMMRARGWSPHSSLNRPRSEGCVSSACDPSKDKCSRLSEDVVECLTEMVFRISRSPSQHLMRINACLPSLLTGEYDAVVPITSKGLMMNVGEIHGSVAFLGYRSFPDRSKGPAEVAGLIRNVGDKIIAVDGVSTIDKSFKDVILMLRESGKNKFAFMRFLENKYAVCSSDLTSVGTTGLYTVEELRKKMSGDRQRLISRRRQKVTLDDCDNDDDEGESDGSVGNSSDEDDSEDEGSEGEFEPDSEDEEIVRKKDGVTLVNSRGEGDATISNVVAASSEDTVSAEGGGAIPETSDISQPEDVASDRKNFAGGGDVRAICDNTRFSLAGTSPADEVVVSLSRDLSASLKANQDPGAQDLIRPETTRSLAFRILDETVGYSSDEGGDEDCAYFVDGVDGTFATVKETEVFRSSSSSHKTDRKSLKDGLQSDEKIDRMENNKVPVKRNDFSSLGESGKMCAAVTLTSREPDVADFDNFPYPSGKENETKKHTHTESRETAGAGEAGSRATEKSLKRSTVKVEQISAASNEVIRVWASAEAAAATLQIPLNEIKQMLKGVYDEELGDEAGGYRWRYAVAGAEVTATAGANTRGSRKGKDAYLAFREKLYDHDEPHSYKNGNKLRDYQIDGVNWLSSTWYKRHSCILADEMGLGKTVQIVAYIEHLYRVEKIHRPYLVVVPLSTVEHWRREFQGWTDMICCVYHDRQRIWRDVMREYEWYYADRPHNPDYLKFDVLITTYDTLIGDFDIIGQIPWRVAVVDEAHRLRNVKGKLLECMKEISARGTLQYGFQSRVLMTGTPLQNNTQELWTLLNFIEPYKFPSLEDFQVNFGNMANREQVEALQRKISPYMLRRVKEDVAKDIPAKEETVIDVELTSIQKQYYRAIFEHNHSFLSMGATRSNAPKLMNIQMELRKCCNHPFLLDGVEQRETDKHFRDLVENRKLEGISPEDQQLLLNEHGYIQTSGKMVLLDKLLPKLRQEGHKVLIFSQMVKMLDLISEYCDFRCFKYERLDGRVRGTERQKAIDRFETQEDSFIFLLSTRAGGVGINLTAADICIIFDSDWNPQNDVQAQARCHRIGQTKDVMIYRLITSRTFEQEMFDRASKKLGLEQAVLGTFGQDNDDDKPSSKEMEQLLKKGAYALLEDENDETGKEFCSDDIESILAKRTRTRVVEGAKTASWLNKQGMVVSKSRFTGDSAAATANVDVDDPLFWQKVMPDFVTPQIMLTKLNDLSELVEGGGSGKNYGKKRSQAEVDVAPENDVGAESGLQLAVVNGKGKETMVDSEERGDRAVENLAVEDAEESEKKARDSRNSSAALQLSRTNQRKVHKFMSDLKSMMDGIFEEDEDDSLPTSEKALCQKLLLTISIKERLFNEEQRHTARAMLKRLEGDRRRRCRAVGEQPARFPSGASNQEEARNTAVREELLILSKHQRRKRRRKEKSGEETSERKRKKKIRDEEQDGGGYLGDDGYLHHSDSEADWSDVGEDIYRSSRKRPGISKKEARRRRAWASDKDAATAAGRPWPAFPRSVVSKVLSTVLEEVTTHDTAKGGIFSVPVPRDVFPEYYDQIKQPMDYGTMKEKLNRGEYRSAQAMQKDFVLVMSNCLQFNAPDSDIVKEARQQALMRPTVLKNAAMKHNLFLAEDGSVLEVYSDGEGEKRVGDRKERGKRRKRRKREEKPDGAGENMQRVAGGAKRLVRCGKCEACRRKDCGECAACVDKSMCGGKGTLKRSCLLRQCKNMKEIVRRRRKRSEAHNSDMSTGDDSMTVDEADSASGSAQTKPRIRISLGGSSSKGDQEEAEGVCAAKIRKKGKKRKAPGASGRKREGSSEDGGADIEHVTPGNRKRRRGEKSPGVNRSNVEKKDSETPRAGAKRKRKAGSEYNAGADSVFLNQRKKENGDNCKSNSEGDVKKESFENVWLNVSLFKKNREALDGTFGAARANFIKHGPWQLPTAVDDDRFVDVATQTLNKMCRNDHYSLFAEEVTEDEAPGYYEVVKSPMDFGTMQRKIDDGSYGTGSAAAVSLYHDFLLIFDNCSLYNDAEGEVAEEASRIFALLPEIYASACSAVAGKRKIPKGRIG